MDNLIAQAEAEEAGLSTGAPPGGWTDADKVPSSGRAMPTAEDIAAKADTAKLAHVAKYNAIRKLGPGDTFTVSGKTYLVDSVDVRGLPGGTSAEVWAKGKRGGTYTLFVPALPGQMMTAISGYPGQAKNVLSSALEVEDKPGVEPKEVDLAAEQKKLRDAIAEHRAAKEARVEDTKVAHGKVYDHLRRLTAGDEIKVGGRTLEVAKVRAMVVPRGSGGFREVVEISGTTPRGSNAWVVMSKNPNTAVSYQSGRTNTRVDFKDLTLPEKSGPEVELTENATFRERAARDKKAAELEQLGKDIIAGVHTEPARPEPSGTSGPSGEHHNHEPNPPGQPAADPKPGKSKARLTAPADSPRGKGERQAKRMFEDDTYVNARKSSKRNFGEDILGSARHKALAWKNLHEALKSEDAEALFTKKFLEKEKPLSLVPLVEREPRAFLAHLYCYFSMKKFPAKPKILKLKQVMLYRLPTSTKKAMGLGDQPDREFDAMSPTEQAEKDKIYSRIQHEHYYESYMMVRDKLEAVAAKNHTDALQVAREAADSMRDGMFEMEKKYGEGSNAREYLRAMIKPLGDKRSKTSPLLKVLGFYKMIDPASARVIADAAKDGSKGEARTAAISTLVSIGAEAAKKVMEGKSVNAEFDVVETGKKRLTRKVAYVANTARKGPPSEFQDYDQAGEAIRDKYQYRGMNWGKYVPDGERDVHMKNLLDASQDMTSLLGLPPQAMSFNGKLGIAIGSRGSQAAAATYEGGEKVINLTRIDGAGSLAHEWGHAFDHLVGESLTGPIGGHLSYLTHQIAADSVHPVNMAIQALQHSEPMRKFMDRLPTAMKAAEAAGMGKMGGTGYWQSNHEVFARCFEQYVRYKLEGKGQSNSYLTGLSDAVDPEILALWPDKEETEAMTPFFDHIFKTFREGDLLHKAMGLRLRRRKSRFTISNGTALGNS